MTIIVNKRLFLTADTDAVGNTVPSTTLVEEGDPRAAFLWAGEGSEVSEEEAKRVGYKGGTKREASDSGSGLTVTKEAAAPDNKAVEAPAEDKAAPAKKAAKRTRKAAKKAT